MKIAAALVLATLSLAVVQASDFVGAYALISIVVFEPSAAKPERVRIEGVFAMADANNSSLYRAPRRGVLYFILPSSSPDVALAEWRDLQSVAGSGEVASMGSREYFMRLSVRGADDKGPPERYQPGLGVIVHRSNTEYAPIKSLLEYR